MTIHPPLLGITDLSCQHDTLAALLLYQLAQLAGESKVIVAADIEPIAGQMLHHGHQGLEVLFLTNLSDGEKEGLVVMDKRWTLLRLIFLDSDAVVNDIESF